ncbi:NUDIX domain-containing protein [Candidatus Woesearchaeota archaeon]|nr:NUDIX domain-containing protein [Nanoarchaeota archaeon]MCB9370250.1 NUDIX domain-containing protein [Candidatus Woesearchaeota archaeon]USN44775.1 MAG: NUDIX domain-containing protein [Candidatus Woesearchaeota archaeon]
MVAVKEYIVVVSAVIFNTEKKILIAKRSEDEDVLPGYFGIPGGKVEEDSNTSDVLIHAVKREIMEEVGIEVEVLSLLNSHIGKDEKKLFVFFLCEHLSGEPQALEDTDSVHWMGLEEIEKLEKQTPFLSQVCAKACQKIRE